MLVTSVPATKPRRCCSVRNVGTSLVRSQICERDEAHNCGEADVELLLLNDPEVVPDRTAFRRGRPAMCAVRTTGDPRPDREESLLAASDKDDKRKLMETDAPARRETPGCRRCMRQLEIGAHFCSRPIASSDLASTGSGEVREFPVLPSSESTAGADGREENAGQSATRSHVGVEGRTRAAARRVMALSRVWRQEW
jgi:hypothetical protein